MLTRRLAAEFLGTAGLLAAIIGSGIMADNLSGGNDGVALIGCTAAIGAALVVLIWLFAPVSGCHINPAVTLAFLLRREISGRDAGLYVVVQAAGGLVGMLVTHLMFDLPLVQAATQIRTGPGQWVSEVVATFGLILTIFGCIKVRPQAVAAAVGPLHLRGLLVHRLDFVRESGGHSGAELHRHLLRDPSARRPGVRADGDPRGGDRDSVCRLALSRQPSGGLLRNLR